jgi:crotonobetainyl-CoA:carnitine CoA-transferase CaiB-like acyl-CoA transferase
MLPGVVLVRQLLDLGARLIRVEDPRGGDPMRQLPPQVGGVGAGFAAFMRGAESVCFDLRQPADAAMVGRLAARADVLVESFRPGTMEGWGLGADALRAANPRLVYLSLSAYGRDPAMAGRIGHDLNFAAEAGVLSQLPGDGIPSIQLADIPAALLACSAILAALLARERSGHGSTLDQPLAAGPLPFLTWAWADAAAGPGSMLTSVLAGRCPCYRTFTCADGAQVALAAIEPKFWQGVLDLLELPHLFLNGIDTGEEGARTVAAMEEVFATRPRAHWLAVAGQRGLPLSPVHDVEAASAASVLRDAGLVEATPMPDGSTLDTPGPFLHSLGQTPDRPAPRLGEHTAAIIEEFALDDE